MKLMLTALAATLLLAAVASGQAPPADPPPSSAPPDIVLLQKGWSVETRNPALDDDPFAPNVEFREDLRAQKMNDIRNAIRARGSETREPPPPRGQSRTGEDETKKPLPSSERRTTYTYRAKLKNTGAKTIRVVHWGYAFFDPDTQEPLGLHRYTAKVRMRPGESVELAGRSGAPQTSTVSAANAGKKLEEMIVIFRVEYDDGSLWQLSFK